MKSFWQNFSVVFTGLIMSSVAAHALAVGQPVPDFSGTGSDGKTYHLSDFKGKYVVLEWHNQGCPYVKKQYESGDMQKLQKDFTKKGVAWLTIISSAPGHQGAVNASEENKYLQEEKASPTAAILDTNGKIGLTYGAKTTPHMFVISPQGYLVYNGAIDDKPTTNVSDTPTQNYVKAALDASMSGKPVAVSATPPYGCSVKYSN